MSLSRIEVITGMSKFSSLKAALSKAGVRGNDRDAGTWMRCGKRNQRV